MRKIAFLKTRNLLILLFSIQLLFGSLITNAQSYRYLRFNCTKSVDDAMVSLNYFAWVDDTGESHKLLGWFVSDALSETPYIKDIDLGVGNEVAISSIHVVTSYTRKQAPSSFTLEGSNDSVTWTVFHTAIDLPASTYKDEASTTKEFVMEGGASTLVLVDSVVIEPQNTTIHEGDEKTYKAIIYPDNATWQGVYWESNDKTVAEIVRWSGISTGKGGGTAQISCTIDGVTGYGTLNVISLDVNKITVSPNTAELEPNDSVQLTKSVLPIYAADSTVTWTSDNEAVATVDTLGMVTSVSIGTANIIATANDGSAITDACIINVVTPRPVTGITLNTKSLSIDIHGQSQLIENFTPENNTNKHVIWSSSDPSIATVNAYGQVVGISEGTADITVTSSSSGVDISDICTVTVSFVSVTGISLDKESVAIFKGYEESMICTILPANASNRDIIWESSNPSVATVDKYGLVSGKGLGTATITATSLNAPGSNFSKVCDITINKKDVFRFLLAGDPHVNVYQYENGWRGAREIWANYPELSLQLGAEMFIALGDLHDNLIEPPAPFKKDSLYSEKNWKVWDEYESTFEGKAQIEWCEGFHEIMGEGAREYFVNNYREHINYVNEIDDNVFISFDMQLYGNAWDLMYPDSNALDWLEYQFIKYKDKRIFLYQHVPMSHSPNWFSPDITHIDSVKFGHDIKLKNDGGYYNFKQTRRLGSMLKKYNIEAMFFGHTHSARYMGNEGGNENFVVYHKPLLVEIEDGEVSYRWITNTLDDDVHKVTKDPYRSIAEKKWSVAVIPPGEDIIESIYDIDVTKPLVLKGGGEVSFTQKNSITDNVDLSTLDGVKIGGKLIVIGPDKLYKNNNPRIQSSMPYSFYFGDELMEISAPTNDLYHLIVGQEASKRFRFVFDVESNKCNFTIYPNSFADANAFTEPYHNNVATLRSFNLDQGELTTDFYPYTRNYIADAPEGVIPIISPKTGNPYASIQITQATNLSGAVAERTATVEVTSQDLSTTYTYTVVFNEQANILNHMPTINSVDDVTNYSRATAYSINLAGISDGDDEILQTVSISANSSDIDVVTDVNINYTAHDKTATLEYTVLGEVGESATITLKVSDNGGTVDGGVNVKEISFKIDVIENPDVSINSNLLGDISVYPNPVTGTLYVSLAEETISQVRITDMVGTPVVLINAKNISGIIPIDVSSLKSGVYMLVVENSESIYKTKFVVK